MNKLTEDEGQVQPRGRGTSIEDVAQTYSFFSVIKRNLDINRFLCAIKIKEEDFISKKYCVMLIISKKSEIRIIDS